MTTLNPYYKGTETMKDIIHKQTAEAINQWGREMFYVTRKNANYDFLFGEDCGATFDGHHKLNFYLNGSNIYGHDEIMSKFGLEMRDEAQITLAGQYFRDKTKLPHPYEGDLIYDPMTHKLFEIKHIDPIDVFFPLETLPQYNMKCEMFEYSHEKMKTGVNAVDMLTTGQDENGADVTPQDEDEINETLNDLNDVMKTVDNWDLDSNVNPDVDDTFVNWDSSNPFGGM
jgi:hypothetical protein